MNQNNKKSIYTVVGIIALVVIILIIKSVAGGDEDMVVGSPIVPVTATSTVASSTAKTPAPKTPAKTATGNAIAPALTDAEINTAIRSAVVRVPTSGVDVTLSSGAASYREGSTSGNIQVGQVFAKVPTTDGYDIFASMTLTDTEKLSSLNYVALFHLSGKTIKYKSALLIGDRLPVVSVVASPQPKYPYVEVLPYMDSTYGYQLKVNYLSRKNLEPATATATVPSDMVAIVKNHIIAR